MGLIVYKNILFKRKETLINKHYPINVIFYLIYPKYLDDIDRSIDEHLVSYFSIDNGEYSGQYTDNIIFKEIELK